MKYKQIVFDGIPELLVLLSKEGCQMGIVTSKTREEYEDEFIPFDIHNA